MSLVRVASGEKTVEIDVCARCKTVWYDKDEFETLVPNDGALQATVSAGKAYRRELALVVTSDLRKKRLQVRDLEAFEDGFEEGLSCARSRRAAGDRCVDEPSGD